MSVNFGPRIQAARKAQGMTQKELAERLGVQNTTVSNWEKNLNKQDGDAIQRLCEILELTPNQLYGVEDRPARNLDDLIREEPVAAYDGLRGYLTEQDKADIAMLIRLRAELNQSRGEHRE